MSDTNLLQDLIDKAHEVYKQTGQAQIVQLDARLYELSRVPGQPFCFEILEGVNLTGEPGGGTYFHLLGNQVELDQSLYIVRNRPGHLSKMILRDFTILGNRSNQQCPWTKPPPGSVIIGLLLDGAWDCGIKRIQVYDIGHVGNDFALHKHENYGIAINNGGRHRIVDCRAYNTFGSGFTLMGHDDGDPASSKLVRCIAHNNLLMGFALSGARDSLLRRCIAVGNGGNGLNDEVGTNNLYLRCISVENGTAGGRQGATYYSGKTTRVKFVQCTFKENKRGVKLESGVVDGEVIESVIQNNHGPGLWSHANSTYIQKDNVVTGNNPDWREFS